MKIVHLICNAHIDPIWQWDWQEGVSAAVSTFQSAVNLADEFDYIFCHNEVTLYQYIEEYAPELFLKIKQLVKCGKWHIMGGWYLQPDCTMPAGESFVRQIMMGQKYFKEKFGVTPTAAVNVDPFGHTRGLVQIVAKCGQNGYLFMRPNSSQLDLAENQFIWEGFDGSKIKATRFGTYSSALGQSADKIKRDKDGNPEPVICSLWGVGNHGGGPSRKDIQDIADLIKDGEKEGIKYIHSTPENYFENIEPTYIFNKSLYSCMPGCYTSMIGLKQKHIELENELYMTEKLCTVASLKGLMEYPTDSLYAAAEDLLNTEFHDVLCGTTVKAGEDNGFKYLQHGLLKVEKEKTKAFFSLLKEEKPAGEGEYPVFVFNPQPYTFETIAECELSLADQNWDQSITSNVVLFDSDGNKIPCQTIKEESNLNLDWRKRFAFSCTLPPLSLKRYTAKIERVPTEIKGCGKSLVFEYNNKHIEIDSKTGLLKNYCYNGIEYIKDGFAPVMFDDNADPWAMGVSQLKQLGENPRDFELMQKPNGVFEKLQSIEVIEEGPLFISVEAFFALENSRVRIEYRIYKESPDIDVKVNVFWQEADKLLRLRIPMCEQGKLIGQTAYGTDDLFMNGKENVSHRFIAMQYESECLAVLNNCQYASMYENGNLYLTLVRGAGYCVHPIEERPLIPENRFIKRIDQGEHDFSFRITVASVEELERKALEFNQKPFVINAFPVAAAYCGKEKTNGTVWIDNRNIVLAVAKKSTDGKRYIFRLFNNSEKPDSAKLSVEHSIWNGKFGRYEVKTIAYQDGKLTELDKMEI